LAEEIDDLKPADLFKVSKDLQFAGQRQAVEIPRKARKPHVV
jgi:hypothetical protein